MKLTEEQSNVIKNICKFEKNIQILGGYAGTGKSTVVKHLDSYLQNFAVCSFTGKAANVLRKKGISKSSTIHSLIYKPVVDSSGNIVLDKNKQPIFTLTDFLEYDGIIIDEASMVSEEIYNDLLSFNLPTIFVGDHGQLEPVNSKFNIMKEPDYRLEEIHRNANEIAVFAEHIRKGNLAKNFISNTGMIEFVTKSEARDLYAKVDQIICAYNKTRVEINVKTRTDKWGTDYKELPVVGDKIICLRNNKKDNLFNGMQGNVVSLDEKYKNKFLFSSDNVEYSLFFDPQQFNKEKYDFSGRKDDPHPFDYCYALTCHKCQGDEWDTGLVIEQVCNNWDHKRWAYTAASRFKNKLYWLPSTNYY